MSRRESAARTLIHVTVHVTGPNPSPRPASFETNTKEKCKRHTNARDCTRPRRAFRILNGRLTRWPRTVSARHVHEKVRFALTPPGPVGRHVSNGFTGTRREMTGNDRRSRVSPSPKRVLQLWPDTWPVAIAEPLLFGRRGERPAPIATLRTETYGMCLTCSSVPRHFDGDQVYVVFEQNTKRKLREPLDPISFI